MASDDFRAAVPTGTPLAIEAGALAALRHGERPAASDAALELVGGVAVIPVTGPLMPGSGGKLAEMGLASGIDRIRLALRTALADREVQAIVLLVNSPGGTVEGLFPLTAEVRAARATKPMAAAVNESGLSAAYAIAAATGNVNLASETAVVGSIGVLAQHVSLAGANEQAGIEVTEIVAGQRKADLSPHAPLNDRGRAALQAQVDHVFRLLTQDIGRSRPRLGADGAAATEAAVHFGRNAIEARLADTIATPETVIMTLSDSEVTNGIR